MSGLEYQPICRGSSTNTTETFFAAAETGVFSYLLICRQKLWGSFDVPAISPNQYVNVTVILNIVMTSNTYKIFYAPSSIGTNWSRIAVGTAEKQNQQFTANCYNNSLQNSSVTLQKHYLLIGY